MPQEKRSVTAEKAVKILKEHGREITLEEAQLILEYMYKMSKLTVNQILNKN